MIAATLETVNYGHIKAVVTGEIWQKGQRYFKHNAVLSLERDVHSLAASVQGTGRHLYQVHIVGTDRSIEHMDCTCPYSSGWGWVCKHIVAVLIAWIEQRDSVYGPGGAQVQVKGYPGAAFGHFDPLYGILLSWFPSSSDVDTKVDLDNEGPGLKVTLFSRTSKRTAILMVPGAESPDMLLRLRPMPGVDLSDRVRAIKFLRQKATHELKAYYDEKGRLVLVPGYSVPQEDGRRIFLEHHGAEQYVLGGRWLWYSSAFAMVEPMPEEFVPYFDDRKPLILDGTGIIDFFTYSMPVLGSRKGFDPSEDVRNTRILSGPKLKQLGVEDSGGWLYLAPYYAADEIPLGIDELMTTMKRDRFVRKGNNWIYVADDIVREWKDIGDIESGRVRVSRLVYTRLRSEIKDSVHIEEPAGLRDFYAVLNRAADIEQAPAIENMKGVLRDYQVSGYNWLYFLYKNGLNGVLADEMGLGKTHQTMALLSTVYRDGAGRPSIVVVPTSVMDHWESKLREYLPWIQVNRYYGKTRSIGSDRAYHILLTTYAVMSRDIDRLSKLEWEYVVLDEAQKIKNYKTKAYRSSRLLAARHRLALTGTPIENKLTELWAIFDFLLPGYLGTQERFIRDYETPIARHGDARKAETLKRVIHPFKLRRMKADVLEDLPPKIEDLRYCSLTSHQASLYRWLIGTQGGVLIKGLNDETRPIAYMHIFALITKLKRLCDHPALVEKGHDGPHSSGKFELFKEIMEEAVDSGEKIVVFSQYLEMMDIIQQWLESKKIGFVSLRGSTRKRADVIKKFQEDGTCRVFVGSLMAGGLGIDLHSASVVVHYDRWWNAAREEQATDRVHRIGQRKSVQIFKLITRGTLEEKIDSMIRRKSSLMNSIVESDDALLKRFSREDLMELLMVPEL
ncbi:MAG: DEAD/DEAH box helicase [Deltaproteobacteria bacterium]|nr:DEAD/DEAH box helicase [Deltaproteobacteria bacterium]MCL5277801.1 DEAD/DEAH box helicase [Deltaproteobacteria bacterium]